MRNSTLVTAPAGSATVTAGWMQTGPGRALRGGSWNNNGRNLRSACRNHNPPDNRNHNIGLRLAGALSIAGGSTNQHPVPLRPRCAGGQIQGPRRGSRPTVEPLPPGRLFSQRWCTLCRPRFGKRGRHAL
jgi:hypothetical protein